MLFICLKLNNVLWDIECILIGKSWFVSGYGVEGQVNKKVARVKREWIQHETGSYIDRVEKKNMA